MIYICGISHTYKDNKKKFLTKKYGRNQYKILNFLGMAHYSISHFLLFVFNFPYLCFPYKN